ncbi:MAG: hypothetical protein WC637_00265 [Victivallales bacterium]|jgi:hypothetical protein
MKRLFLILLLLWPLSVSAEVITGNPLPTLYTPPPSFTAPNVSVCEIVNGCTGQTTAQAAIDALSQVSTATNEYVLTKDATTGQAKWKATASTMVYPGAGIALSTGAAWGASITDASANWNTAYTDRLKWDGGATGLVAATARTSLGSGLSAGSVLVTNTINTLTELNSTVGTTYLKNAAGTISWAAGTTTPGGNDTEVQFNDGGTLAGDTTFVWNKTTNTLTLQTAPTNSEPLIAGYEGYDMLGGSVGTNLSPSTSVKPSVRFEKFTSANLIGGATYQGGALVATTFKTGGTAYVASIFGYALLGDGTGDTVGVAAGAINNLAAAGNVWGLWAYAVSTSATNAKTVGIETNTFAFADNGHMATYAAGCHVGLLISNYTNHGTWGIDITKGSGATGKQWHTGIIIETDSIVPLSGTVNEAILIQGGSAAATRYGGIIMNSGTFEYGLDFNGGTYNAAPIRIPNNTVLKARNAAGAADISLIGLGADNVLYMYGTAFGLTSAGAITAATWQGVAVATGYGGTGAANAADARTNLGLAIGTNVQAYNSNLTAIDQALDTTASPTFADLTLTGHLHMPNVQAIWMKDAGGTLRNTMYLLNDAAPSSLLIGAGASQVCIYIGGTAYKVSIDGSGFLKGAAL